MDYYFNPNICINYKSPVQKIRLMSEEWTERNIFCPNCGGSIVKFPNNNPASDFYCKSCKEEYELKSKKNTFGNTIVDGAYSKMSEKIYNNTVPNFFLLNYDSQNFSIINFFVIPKHFLTLDLLNKRNPLSANAKRSGWIGCNILIGEIPFSGRIYYFKNKEREEKENILKRWQSTLFLREENNLRGWTLDIMKCIDKIGKEEFELEDIYKYESYLRAKYSSNKHIKDKIRQQLQFLRDKGYLTFVNNRGKYKRSIL